MDDMEDVENIFDLFAEDEAPRTHQMVSAKGVQSQRGSMPRKKRNQTGFAGLVNLGTTCYLNSLIQTMYFTPPLRRRFFALALHTLGVEEGQDDESKIRKIPYELLVFARLASLDAEAVELKGLTKSFNWEHSQEIQQHDVQELNRVLFDALAKSFVNSPSQSMLSDLYTGTTVTLTQCLSCGYSSEREERLDDISVPIKGFADLEASLRDYTALELMTGANKYKCSGCEQLCDAHRGVKFRQLPAVLTLNLMRFSYDWERNRRTKENGKFAFPERLQMQPYCMEDVDTSNYEYELFSVVIHRGQAQSGHYFAYTRDLLNQGNWKPPAVKKKAPKKVDYLRHDHPVDVLHGLLLEAYQSGGEQISFGDVGDLLSAKTGQSWNQRYKKGFGGLRKFLQKWPLVFALPSADGIALTAAALECELGQAQKIKHASTDKPAAKAATSAAAIDESDVAGSQWFRLDDNTASCIDYKEVERTFQGSESAYMLFYIRRDQFDDATIPSLSEELQAMVDRENKELIEEREAYEEALNRLTVTVYSQAAFSAVDGTLTPLLSNMDEAKEAQLLTVLTLDRRQSIAQLRREIADRLTGLPAASDVLLHRLNVLADELFYVADPVVLSGTETPLMETPLQDGMVLLAWDGENVAGSAIKTGQEHEPINISVTILGRTPEEDTTSVLSLPQSANLRELRCRLAAQAGLDVNYALLHRVDAEACPDGEPLHLDEKADGRSLCDLKFHRASCVTVEQAGTGDIPQANRYFSRKLNWVNLELASAVPCSGEQPTPVAQDLERKMTMKALKVHAKDLFGISEELDELRLRVVDTEVEETGLGKLVTQENKTIGDHRLKAGSTVQVEVGTLPNLKTTRVLRFKLGPRYLAAAKEDESIDDIKLLKLGRVHYETQATLDMTIKQVVADMRAIADVKNQPQWSFYHASWVGEPGESVTNFDMTVKTLNPQQNQLFVLDIGTSLPKGYVRVPIWLDTLNSSASHDTDGWLSALQATATVADQAELEAAMEGSDPMDYGAVLAALAEPGPAPESLAKSVHLMRDSGLHCLGKVDLSNDAKLVELKAELLKLPALADRALIATQLRLQEKLGHVKGRVLRDGNAMIKKCKIAGSGVVVTLLDTEGEHQPMFTMNLRIARRYPGLQAISLPQWIEFFDGPHPSLEALKRRIYMLFPEVEVGDMILAKHIATKGEWKVLQTPAKAGVKKKGKKGKPPSIRTPPNSLKDGDLVVMKNFLEDPEGTDTFLTEYDINYQRMLSTAAEHKRLERTQTSGSSGRGPEVGVTIAVPDFN